MFNHFTKNNGPVFMSDSVSGPSGASSGGFGGQLQGLEQQNEASTFNDYVKSFQMKKEQNEEQMFGDAAQKALHAVNFS